MKQVAKIVGWSSTFCNIAKLVAECDKSTVPRTDLLSGAKQVARKNYIISVPSP